jgi:osmotically-inducible protein OsmY
MNLLIMTPHVEEIKKQDIIDQLARDDSVNASKVLVSVEGRTVELSGTVTNYNAKLSAERDAYLVKGVNHVENHLEIEYPPTLKLPADEEIKQNLERMLAWNSRINDAQIRVNANKGVVSLTGSVHSYWEKQLAGEMALSLTGVISVNNNLKVSPPRSIIDRELEKSLKDSYQRSMLIDEDKFTIRVKDGIVTLSGVVSSQPIRNEIVSIAIYTSGVKDVVNELTIG